MSYTLVSIYYKLHKIRFLRLLFSACINDYSNRGYHDKVDQRWSQENNNTFRKIIF